MDTMKVYLTAIAADSDNTAQVNFDTVSSEVDTETTGVSTTTLNVLGTTSVSSTTNEATVLKMTPSSVTTAAVADKAATTMKRGWYVDQTNANGVHQFTINGVSVPATAYALTGNAAVDALNIASTANKDLASAAGVLLDAKVGGFSSATVSLVDYPAGTQSTSDERYTSAAVSSAATSTGSLFTTGREDEFTLTVGSNSVTASLSGYGVAGTAMADIEEAIVAAWAYKYGSAGVASLSAIATIADNGDGILTIDMLQDDSGGYNQAVSFSVSNKTTTTNLGGATRTSGNIGYVIGSTVATNDNVTTGDSNKSLIITLTSKNSGTAQNSVLSGVTTRTAAIAATLVEYTTTYTANTAWTGSTTAYAGVSQPRTDVVTAEAFVAGSAAVSSTAVNFSRVSWLG
jgi:hypothetical protein